jgi:ferrochelatase
VTGLLLINLGTPASPHPRDVRAYLREFLSDRRVLDVPAFQRRLVLELLILPRRPRRSAEAYRKIWTERGSPLAFHTADLAAKVRERLGAGTIVEWAMRYGEPSIRSRLASLSERGADRIVVFPLYPQYSSAATGSSLEEVYRVAGTAWNVPRIHVVPPFYDHPAFIAACAALARPWVGRPDVERVYFSFHGLPERQVRKSDPTGRHCLVRDDCCERLGPANRCCYRAQCMATTRALVATLGLDGSRARVGFQSRLGRNPWIRPYTDELIVEDARAGVRRAVMLAPAFVADCLETLEELGIRAVESWREAGGERLDVVPCVNATDGWADAVITIARDALAVHPVPAAGTR